METLVDLKKKLQAEGTVLVYDDGLILPLDREKFENEKIRIKFIKGVEVLVRRSIEYKEFVGFVKYTMGQKYCAFTLEDDDETGDVELHHHPLTMFDIVEAVVNKFEEENKGINSFKVASHVIELHYRLKVGFIPLIKTLHRKFHNGFLKIPIEFVIGDYKYIIENYPLPQEVKDKVNYYESITLDKVKNYWYPGLKMDNTKD